ncbi:MAG: glycoside hydrolase family 97 protein [Prevotella sp.]|nr:glycoside hydrolase family 97 protein [Prevotella sp.]
MKKIAGVLTMLCLCLTTWATNWIQTHELSSPNGQLKVKMTSSSNGLSWCIEKGGQTVMLPSQIGLVVNGKEAILGKARKVQCQEVNQSFATPFYKKARVDDHYATLTLRFGKANVEFRAYDDGAAYRILWTGKATNIDNEQAQFCFEGDPKAFVPYVNDNRAGERYCYSFESYYDEVNLSAMHRDSLAISPLAICLANGRKAIVMDCGVENYPGMMLVRDASASRTPGSECLNAVFAPYPLQQEVGGFDRLNLVPTQRASYIARINACQSLPWRVVVVTDRDADILNCDMAQRLAPACRVKDTSWIRPGKVAWDWWNNTNLTGVDFASGMNTDTYQYYIDFASKNHLEYIIIDEGWSGKESLMEDLSPVIDLDRLIAYGKQKGVGIILWSSWRNLIGNRPADGYDVAETVMSHYAKRGVKGFKVDFFDRDDQEVIASAYRLADIGAKHHLMLDFHGLKPFGIQRAYPNVVNFEGVKGLENSKWEPRVGDGPLHNQPRYDVTAPYLRMLCGPMDYTPGAMTNAMKNNFFGNNDNPMSQGTRVHQMAMYTMFEAPLQMLADSPSAYEREQECTDFIAQVPTTFDETIAIDGQLGEYTIVARRKGDTWFVAAMTDWTPREFTINLSFLGEGNHEASIFADGTNAMKDARDYRHTTKTVTASDQLHIKLSSGGGWTAIIK